MPARQLGHEALTVAAGGAREFQATYDVKEELGRGSFGVVQRVRHRQTGQYRAVKRVPCGGSEQEVLASLDHPNVAGFYECFREGNELLLVQELCEGGPLEALLQRAQGRGLGGGPETARILRQMLEAVKHCHDRGFVHRDLKADNFVFASGEPASALKLIDFGLADRLSHRERLAGRAGTVEHTAPEALAEGANYGPAAEVWALGAIFFLLLSGEPLIKVSEPAATPSEELRQVLREEAARKVADARYVQLRVQSLGSRIPPVAADLLQEMLARNPAARITAEEALQHPFLLERATRGCRA